MSTPGKFDFSSLVNTFLPKINDAIRNTASVITRDNPFRATKPNADPYSSAGVNKFDLSNTNDVQMGMIAEALPFWGWYKVVSFSGGYVIPCNLMSDSSQTPIGARRIGNLQPHTKVYFIHLHNASYGTIIGVEPEVMPDVADTLPDFISLTSNFVVTDEFTNRHLYTSDNQCMGDFSRGSPLDSTLSGERGWITETGTSIFLDSFMAFVRADENCGFWAFHMDQLARMHGHNIQIRACSYEHESFTDMAESYGYTGIAAYPWEGLGALEQSTPTASEVENGYFDVAEGYGEETQMPYHRLQTYTGYLGQGFRQILRLLPDDTGSVNKLGQRGGDIAWEQHLSLDGNYHIRSAQGITIAHCPLYRSPARAFRIEDQQNGDKYENYKFSGAIGSGDTHEIQDTPIKSDSYAAKALMADDDLAYSFAWRNEHPFVYHKNDFITYNDPEPEATPSYQDLKSKWYAKAPDIVNKKIDHRFSAEYNNLLSYFKIMPDGTIVIAGPNGEEIRMVGGSIELSCPGDIQLRPGRNVISLAGRSTCIRSKEDIDICSSDADVRVKAEKNMFILGGNGSTGGEVIIENKSHADKGIVLRSGTDVNVVAETDIYIRSGSAGEARHIVLDAGGADAGGDICFSGERVSAFVNEGRFDFFGTNGSVTNSNAFTSTGTTIGSGLYSKDTIAGLGYLIVRDYIVSTQGHIATALAKDFNGFVGGLDGEVKDGATAAQLADDQLSQIEDYIEETNQSGAELFTGLVTTPFRESGKIGDEDQANGWGRYAFRFKDTAEYKADDFTIYESRWQQRARLFGSAPDKWKENPVVYLEENTYPYPGKTAWVDSDSYKEVDLMFYNLLPSQEIGLHQNNGEETASAPDGNYGVIG